MFKNSSHARRRACFLWSAVLLVISCAGADTAKTPNLIRNGDFENVAGGQATDWSFSSAQPEIFQLSFPTETARGHVARMDVSSSVMSGYFNQAITLKPHTHYRFTALAQVARGKMLIYIHGGSGPNKLDTRIYVETLENHPLVPWFWDKTWIEGSSGYPNPNGGLVRTFLCEPGQWEPVSIDFNAGELTRATISLGAYFEAGEYLFDNVSVTEIPAAP